MSVKSFKFVSPGIFINEVDNSQLPRLPEELGPVIIGRAERGPAMVPVKIDSFSDFVETFGSPIAGGEGDDVWRQGNRLGPTYAAFAAQAYLKSASPITFVRLLGEANANKSATGVAGWKAAHAYGLFVGDTAKSSDDRHLAAVIYSDNADLGLFDSGAKTNADITVTAGKIPFADDAGTAASSATVDLTINTALSVSAVTPATVATGVLIKDNNTPTLSVELFFDPNSVGNLYDAPDGGNGRLTVGVNGITTASGQAAAIVGAINSIPAAEFKVTATLDGFVVKLVSDDTGALSGAADGLLQLSSPASTGSAYTRDNFVDGAASAAAFAKTTFNFDDNSKLYIRNVLNTNPTLTNGVITATSAQKNYWLGATFDSFVIDSAKITDGASASINKARLVKLDDTFNISDAVFSNMELSAQAPATPMVVSQYVGLPGDFNSQDPQVQNLFKIHALYAGEWEQKNFKISISDVAAPKNSFTKYGTFSVIVRDAKDTDAAPVIYERFSNCDLDPTSSNYIGVKIGDMKQVWSDLELRYIEEGQYLNQSRFIRVEVVDAVESGTTNAELLPFGFMVPKTIANKTDSQEDKFPQLSLRANSRGTKLSSPSQAFFGITTEGSGERFDPSYADATRRLIKSDDGLTKHTNFFSLDLLKALGTDSPTQQPDATYDEGFTDSRNFF